MLVALLTTLALAGGYYHPDDIATASALYAQAATEAGGTFEKTSTRSEAVARALEDYELALDLLGDGAPPAQRERVQALRKAYNRERATLEAFAEAMMEDFDAEFTAAMERAVATAAPDAVECVAQVPKSKKPIPGIPVRYVPNPECTGDDLNAAVAGAMDADPVLQAAVAEILALEWPALTAEEAPQAAAGLDGAGRSGAYVRVDAFLRPLVGEELRAIDLEDEEARLPFEAALEGGATKAELAELAEEAHGITAATARKRAALAVPLLELAEARWAKLNKGVPAPAWCANPRTLGACEGEDATEALSTLLDEDARFQKALP